MSHIFVSYSREDGDYAHRLKAALERLGFPVWMDTHIGFGAEFANVIEEHLEQCAAFVVIMTSRSRASMWVRNELYRALDLRKPILPLLLEGERTWFEVSSLHYVDVRDGSLPPDHFFDGLKFVVPVQSPAPKIDWCKIPAGAVTMQLLPNQTVPVGAFEISKYPVTNAQFQAFVDAQDGYVDEQWWDFSAAALKWHARSPQPKPAAFEGDDHPRAHVSWYEAVAFCRWLTEKVGAQRAAPLQKSIITLPTEQQWQRAAQGDDHRLYPWGSQPFDPSRANIAEKGARRTTPVTQHPDGASPFGVYDMVGNVWEWTLSLWQGGTDLESSARRVVRGGAWDCTKGSAQVTSRPPCEIDSQHPNIGFRIARVTGEE